MKGSDTSSNGFKLGEFKELKEGECGELQGGVSVACGGL